MKAIYGIGTRAEYRIQRNIEINCLFIPIWEVCFQIVMSKEACQAPCGVRMQIKRWHKAEIYTESVWSVEVLILEFPELDSGNVCDLWINHKCKENEWPKVLCTCEPWRRQQWDFSWKQFSLNFPTGFFFCRNVQPFALLCYAREITFTWKVIIVALWVTICWLW